MVQYQIYKATNLINGKVYIGQTSREMRFRIAEHIYKQTLLGADIVEFGKINFKFEVIDHAHFKDEADKKEIFYIDYYNCLAPNGYNQSIGGAGAKGCHNGAKNYFFGKRGKLAKNSIPIKCLESGEIFDCIKSAAEYFHGDRSFLTKHLKGKYKSFKGLHFILLER